MESFLQIKKGKQLFEGNVTYEEGDLIEVVFPDDLEVSVGDQLPCLLTDNYETISNFEAVVLAKEKNRVFLFHSPTVVEYREQRRRYPRFDVNLSAWVQCKLTSAHGRLPLHAQRVQLTNLSLGGLALRTEKQLACENKFILSTELYGRGRSDGAIQVEVQVIHQRMEKDTYHYGCKIVGIQSRYFHTLRKYILERQLEERRHSHL
ncbi:PilZ domain-containing protein [Brevibacillus ruminantium]|uniref:PilZ domain-containing protein n=1 Tax=Brevibacillus ruminantium TaxID=2950604 RepID=A0ABY4WHN3_9BACL|nr:PilZ domain-containing protein [Brevibacillus ruminantium]USG64849.1 PilZ domain-containing protein [Brevibacillus ruminantium]